MATVDRVGNALQEAGAPLPSREDMTRLYKGRMAEVLDFGASNITGRQAAASARGALQT